MEIRQGPVGPRDRLRRYVTALRKRLDQVEQPAVRRQQPAPVRQPRPPEREPDPALRRTVAEFFALIDGLVRRPVRTDRGLPIVWLTGNRDGRPVLDALEDLVKAETTSGHRYRVPFARVPANRITERGDLRDFLKSVYQQLFLQRFGGERLWFRHVELVEWLMAQNLSTVPVGDAPAEILNRLRTRHRGAADTVADKNAGTDAASMFSTGYRLIVVFLRWIVPNLLFRAAVSGRIPGIGRQYRWFMRQQYLAPQQSVTFLGFAERLTSGVWETEDRDQLNKLLVHAFLEDLRRAYARRPWRVEGWRRTAYPLLLIDNVARGTDGHLLLQLINDVRNETGRGDPLLVVCTSDHGPPATVPAMPGIGPRGVGQRGVAGPRGTEAGTDERRLRESDAGYRRWADALPYSRRARIATAWNFPVVVTDPDRTGAAGRPMLPSRPPWFARRSVALVAVLALVTPIVGVVGWQLGWVDCRHWPLAGTVSVRDIGDQCIGYTDSTAFRFNDEPGQQKLRDVQDLIFRQNAAAMNRWEQIGKRRPLITIVYLGTLTGRETAPDEEAYSAEREELEGLAVAQNVGLEDPATEGNSALVRIVIANGGFQMRHVGRAAAMIADLARDDPTVVAVVGLVESRTGTGQAMRDLHAAGLPVIGPALSADEFYKYSPLYLQLSPPNQLQARMFLEYADVIGVDSVRIYHTVGENSTLDEDLYVRTLLEDLEQNFDKRIEYARPFESDTSLKGECGYDGMLIFNGRWNNFSSFVRELGECNDNPPAHLVTNDSVNRYMANPTLRGSAPGNLPLTFVSKSALGTCQRLIGARDSSPGDEVRGRFLRLVQKEGLLRPARCGEGDSSEPVGERVPLAYDAGMLVIRAAEELAGRLRSPDGGAWDPRSIKPVAVHTEILRLNADVPFAGVTGSTLFNQATGEPVSKRISLMQVQSIPELDAVPREVFHCGAARNNEDPNCQVPPS